MSKSEVGAGLGVAALLAVCCGGHLLLLALVGSGLAILTGETVLIAAGVLVALAAVGAYAWRRRASQCATSTCTPDQTQSAVWSLDVPAEANRGGASDSAPARQSQCTDRLGDDWGGSVATRPERHAAFVLTHHDALDALGSSGARVCRFHPGEVEAEHAAEEECVCNELLNRIRLRGEPVPAKDRR